MTKAIKFNLLLDKHPVRDLDDLRANFNLDDLLTAYHSHTLHRWLEVRGLTAELSQLMEIKSRNELTIASALCKLFHETINEADIKTAVYPLEFRKQQQQQLNELDSQKFEKNAVIKSYHAGYKKLCVEMLEKADDYPFLKAAVNMLWTDYAKLFRVDFNRFFDQFIEKSPLTLFTMLANDNYRQSGIFNQKKTIMFRSIGDSIIANKPEKKEYMGFVDEPDYGDRKPLLNHFKSYASITDGHWKDLEPKGTKCLILRMIAGNFIRNSGKNGEEFNNYDINEEFLIFDGIDYKSNNANHALIYMVI